MKEAESPTSPVRRRVWIVDDSALDADRAYRALSSLYDLEVFDDGSAALERLAAAPRAPDLLVLDWMMPGVSGIDVCRFLRSSPPPLSSVPVLLLTVHQRTEQVVEGLNAGANDYLSKPFAEAELLARVGSLVRNQILMERLQAAESTVRHLLASTPDALLALDAQGAIGFASHESEILFGRPAEELERLRITDVLPTLHDFRRGGAWPDVTIGAQHVAPMVGRVQREGAEQWIVSLRNVTTERERQQRRLDFYSIVAHDLRSPLTAALLRTDVMLEEVHGPISAGIREDLHRLQRNLGELIAMVNDFLELARHEATPQLAEHEAVDLGELIREATEDFEPLATANRLALSTRVPDDRVSVQGERRRLKQALSNLIANAIKFTESGGRVEVSLTSEGDRATIAVRDTGRGIAAAHLPTIFDRYSRIIDRDHEVVGSGLGLMIVKQTIEVHGGHVGVESAAGEGSTFWFSLPRAA